MRGFDTYIDPCGAQGMIEHVQRVRASVALEKAVPAR
jgi:hypothetical protein